MNKTEENVKSMSMGVSVAESFVEIEVPQQKLCNGGVRFPAVLSPPPHPLPALPLTESIRTHKQFLESLLLESGALLFRGFPVNTPSDFNDVVEAFGYEELPYVGGVAPRTRVVGRVFTSNESPPDQAIAFHPEMAMIPGYPSKLFFFCEVEPLIGSGGETPIVESHVVYDRMKERHPEFVERLEKHGLLYTRVLAEHDDPSCIIGRGWKSTFSTTDKTIAQQRAGEMGMKLEWLENERVKVTVGPVGGVKYDERRERSVWFTSMVGWEDPTKPGTLGDGEAIAVDIVNDCLRTMEEECVAIPWRKGDFLLIDNTAVLHARRSCSTPRRLLASLAK